MCEVNVEPLNTYFEGTADLLFLQGLEAKSFRIDREALREHLKKLGVRVSEERDREGYKNQPQAREEFSSWEAAAAWPKE